MLEAYHDATSAKVKNRPLANGDQFPLVFILLLLAAAAAAETDAASCRGSIDGEMGVDLGDWKAIGSSRGRSEGRTSGVWGFGRRMELIREEKQGFFDRKEGEELERRKWKRRLSFVRFQNRNLF